MLTQRCQDGTSVTLNEEMLGPIIKQTVDFDLVRDKITRTIERRIESAMIPYGYGPGMLTYGGTTAEVYNVQVRYERDATYQWAEAGTSSSPYYRFPNTTGTWGTISYTETINSTDWKWDAPCPWGKSPQDRLKEMIHARMAPRVHVRNRHDYNLSPAEIRARETLRLVVGEDQYRSFLKNGWVTVRGDRGLHYQIFAGHGVTKVYENGKQIEKLCVVMNGGFAPTDSLVMRYLMILNSEAEFRKLAIKSGAEPRYEKSKIITDLRPLPDLMKSFRLAG
jgi:hypothetical protein